MRRVATFLVGMALVLSVPGSALAASSTCQAYNSQTGCTTTTGTTTGIPASTTATTGSLPFTGMDVVLLLAGAGILICTGLFVRRLSHTQD